MRLNGAQIVVETLCLHGADTVFGYPGGAVLPLYDALYENSHRICHILTAHEQGAAHAADGYARASGKTGVVIATSGPGATNLVTGIANAYLDSIPMVAITGNVPVALLNRDSFQEVDMVGITKPVTKAGFIVKDIEKLEETLNKAFQSAGSGRPGPVVVDIPRNIQIEMCEYNGQSEKLTTDEKLTIDADLSEIIDIIKNSKRPFIYAGGGIISSGAENQLCALSERLNAPVGLSMMGLTALPDDYPLNLKMSGMHGNYSSTVAQSECDVMLCLGVRFSDRATGNVGVFSEKKTIIHVDVDTAEHGKNVPSQINLHGDAKQIITRLLELLPPLENPKWQARIKELQQEEVVEPTAEFTPQGIIQTVNSFCDEDTVIATDVGQHQMWVMQSYRFKKPRTLLTSCGLGAMGYGFGAAIGGCMANGGRRTVLFTGDGSFGMNLIELATAVSQKLPIVIVILNNNALGLPRQWQTMFFGERYSQSTLDRKTDFAALAKAFGAQGHRAASLSELSEIMAKLPDKSPVVIDCHIKIDEKVFPIIPPGGSVKDMVRKAGR
jgi:acetolactate synthase-1/2/3 large subunit